MPPTKGKQQRQNHHDKMRSFQESGGPSPSLSNVTNLLGDPGHQVLCSISPHPHNPISQMRKLRLGEGTRSAQGQAPAGCGEGPHPAKLSRDHEHPWLPVRLKTSPPSLCLWGTGLALWLEPTPAFHFQKPSSLGLLLHFPLEASLV